MQPLNSFFIFSSSKRNMQTLCGSTNCSTYSVALTIFPFHLHLVSEIILFSAVPLENICIAVKQVAKKLSDDLRFLRIPLFYSSNRSGQSPWIKGKHKYFELKDQIVLLTVLFASLKRRREVTLEHKAHDSYLLIMSISTVSKSGRGIGLMVSSGNANSTGQSETQVAQSETNLSAQAISIRGKVWI